MSLLDDEFEVVLFEGKSLRYAKYLVGMVAGRISGMTGVSVFRAREISIAAAPERVHLQIDGEYAGGLPELCRYRPFVAGGEALTLAPKLLAALDAW